MKTIAGLGGDGRFLAADDAGHGDGLLLVGDDQHLGGQGGVAAVQGPDPFAFLGPAHDDAGPGDLGQVEGMDGLARGEKDVIGDVHDVVDGVQPHGLDAGPQPVGRRPDRDAADDQAAIARAEVLVLDLDGDEVGRPGGHLGQRPGPLLERLAQQGGDLAGHAHVPQRVGAVGVRLHVQHHVAGLLLGLLDDEADHGQAVDEFLEGQVDIDVFLEPGQTDFHLRWNCLLKRRSFS